jgi:hypothetical protein
MANSKLLGTLHAIPDEVMAHLKGIMKQNGDAGGAGIKRLKGLLDKGYCTYEQLKRIKNFFDHHPLKTEADQVQFNINGGQMMKDWVNHRLEQIRGAIYGKNKLGADTAAPTVDDVNAPEAHTPQAINRAVVDTSDAILSTSDLNQGLMEQVDKMKQLYKKL